MPSDQPASSGTSTEIQSQDQSATTRQSNSKKRTAPDEGSSSQTREIKKLRTDSTRRSDKKKRTVKKKRSQPITARVLPTNGLPPHHSGKHAQRGSMAIKQLRSESKDKSRSPVIEAESGEEGAAQNSSTSTKLPSAPSSSKGKSRDTTPAPAKPNEEVLRLRKEVEQLTSLLQMHENTLTQVHQNATCQICIDTMHKPYTLAPCGHLACYDCLVSWFKAPAPSGGDQPPPLARRKTCPHCRAVVRERPIEAWGVKSIVHNLVESGLLKGVSAPTATPDETAPKDPWEGIFRPVSKNPDTDPYGIFEGRLDRGGEMSGPQIGMYDVEDGVHRCIDCMHELFGGVCSSCAREYPENPEFGMDDEDSDTDLDFGRHGHRRFGLLGQLFAHEPDFDDEEDEDEDYPIVHHPWPPHHHHHHPHHPHHPHPEDEEGSDYEGSFIDDGPAPVRNEVIEIDGDSGSEDYGTPAHLLGNGTIELDDDDDDISVDDSVPVRRVPARRFVYNVDSDEEEERDSDVNVQVHREGPRDFYGGSDDEEMYHSAGEDEHDPTAGWGDDGSIPGPPRHLRHTIEGGGHHWDDDEEEAEDHDEYGYHMGRGGGNGVPVHHYAAHLDVHGDEDEEDEEEMYVHRPMTQHHRARYVESESEEDEDDSYAGDRAYEW